MSDTSSKLRAIQAALDERRTIDVEGLDAVERAEAEGLARVDAWLRASPTQALTEAEEDALARRIEQRLGETLAAGDDPLAPPDFSEWGDDEAPISALPPTSSGEYALDSLAARASSPAGASSPAASRPAPAALGPVTGGVPAIAPTGARSGSGGTPRGRAWFFASAAVLGLAVTGSFVALRSASAPEATTVAAPMAEAATATLAEEAANEDFEGRFRELGGAPPAAATPEAAAPAAPAVSAEPAERSAGADLRAEAELDWARSTRGGGMASTREMEGLEVAELAPFEAPGVVRRAAPTSGSTQRPRMQTTSPSIGAGVPATAMEAPREVAMDAVDDTTGFAIERSVTLRREVFRCVDVPNLTTRVLVRDSRVVEVSSTTPQVDDDTRACLTRALRGAPFDGPSGAALRWRR